MKLAKGKWKRYAVTLSCALLALTGSNFAPGAKHVEAEATNGGAVLLSQGKPAVSSSAQDKYAASEANDGAVETRWMAKTGDYPQWWQVDLGDLYFVSRLESDWYKSDKWNYQYKIEVSADSVHFQTAVDRSAATVSGDTTDDVLYTARYVRVEVTGCSTPDSAEAAEGRAGADEFKVFGVSVPTDNPVTALYGSDYSWSDSIKWSNVKDIDFFPGNSAMEKFEAARDAASSDGGGVVYFPAGSYHFDDNLSLKNGVVIRGDAPAQSDAKADGFAPPSKLEFPQYIPSLTGSGTDNATAFKKIVTENPNTDSHIGVVNLDINRAGINLEGDANNGTNTDIVVLGVRSNNVADPDPNVPSKNSYQELWQRLSYRFTANVSIQAYANVLVAGSRLNDNPTDDYEQPGYKIKKGNDVVALQGDQAVFRYTDHYGIRVNRGGGYGGGVTPDNAPGIFRKGIAVRDNWVFKTMRVGVYAAGDGLLVKDNVIRDKSGKKSYMDPAGAKASSGSNTFENRGIDWSGWNVTIDGNDYEVYSHEIGFSPGYYSTDGEGILQQECCGGAIINGITITNNRGNGYIGLYKSRDIANVEISGNTLYRANSAQLGGTMIYVNANTNSGNFALKNVHVDNNQVMGSIEFDGGTGITDSSVMGNTLTGSLYIGGGPAGTNSGFTVSVNRSTNAGAVEVKPNVSDVIQDFSANTGFVPMNVDFLMTVSGITDHSARLNFRDVSPYGVDETGYYVEHKVGSNWVKWDGTEIGPQAGPDVTLPLEGLTPSTSYEVRVVAFNDAGASAPSRSFKFTTTATGANQAPTVNITKISDGNDEIFVNNERIAIEAVAADTDGSIANVEFYWNGEKLGEDKSAPYSYNYKYGWKAGDYIIQAVAIDNNGEMAVSEPVHVVVNP